MMMEAARGNWSNVIMLPVFYRNLLSLDGLTTLLLTLETLFLNFIRSCGVGDATVKSCERQ